MNLLRAKASDSLTILDSTSETPELLWTTEMKKELRESLSGLLLGAGGEVNWKLDMPSGFFVVFRQINEELFIGGVYIRLYMKQNTYRLSNPIHFVEILLSRWEEAFEAQVKESKSTKVSRVEDNETSKSYALVVGKEDFLSLMTSCIVCAIRSEVALIDHVLTWGFADRGTTLLKRALDGGKRGVPVLSVIRILHELAVNVEVSEALASSKGNVILQLRRALHPSDSLTVTQFPSDSAIVAELLKKILRFANRPTLASFCSAALSCALPELLIINVISRQQSDSIFAAVKNAPSFYMHCVDILKMMAMCEPAVQSRLDSTAAWNEYRYLNHDLYITVSGDPNLRRQISASRRSYLSLKRSA